MAAAVGLTLAVPVSVPVFRALYGRWPWAEPRLTDDESALLWSRMNMIASGPGAPLVVPPSASVGYKMVATLFSDSEEATRGTVAGIIGARRYADLRRHGWTFYLTNEEAVP